MKKYLKTPMIITAAGFIAAAAILFALPQSREFLFSMKGEEQQISAAKEQTPAKSAPQDTGNLNKATESVKAGGLPSEQAEPEETDKSREIEVINNTLEYDMKAFLTRSGANAVTLGFEYYNNGTVAVKEFDSGSIPELASVSADPEGMRSAGERYSIGPVTLNAKAGRAYFVFESLPGLKEAGASVYSFDLQKSSVKALFSAGGAITPLSFTKDGRYAAFGLRSSEMPAKSYLQIIECAKDSLKVEKNKNSKGILIGGNEGAKLSGGYGFTSWYSNATASLLSLDLKKNLLYEIESDTLKNMDMSSLSPAAAGKGQTASQPAKESEPVKALKGFYEALAAGEFNKAYDLLDDRFTLNIFKEFGIGELSKQDIKVEEFSQFGTVLQAARIQKIVKESTKGDKSQIYFYQLVSFEQGDNVQPLAVDLRKTAKGWKISSVNEGDPAEPPFSSN